MGELTGLIIVLSVNSDFVALEISLILACIQLPLATSILMPSEKTQIQSWKVRFDPELFQEIKNDTKKVREKQRQIKIKKGGPSIAIVSIAFLLIGTLIFEITKDIYGFLLPILIFETFDTTALTYLTIFSQQILQMISIHWIGSVSQRKKFPLFIFGILGTLTCTIVLLIDHLPIAGIIGIFLIVSFVNGFVYAYPAHLSLQYGQAEGTLKFNGIFQSITALGFGISPLLAGILSERDIKWNYYALVGLLVIGTVALWFLKQPRNHTITKTIEEATRLFTTTLMQNVRKISYGSIFTDNVINSIQNETRIDPTAKCRSLLYGQSALYQSASKIA
jgi:MFS family permease